MCIEAEMLDEASSAAKLHATGRASTDVRNNRLDAVRNGPVLLGHVLLETFKFVKGARAPRAGELYWIVGFEPRLFLRVVGMVRRERNARRGSDLKKVFGRRLC